MTLPNSPQRPMRRCEPNTPAPAATLRRTPFLLAVLASIALLAAGCNRSDPTQTPRPPKTDVTQTDTAPTKAELEQRAREREAFGLPLPPDAVHIHRAEAYVRANSFMKLTELEAFYKKRLVDYEFLYPQSTTNSNRQPRELHIIGLRAFMPQITIRYSGGKHGTADLDFRPAQSPQITRYADTNTITDQPTSANIPQTNQNRRREPGMPVLDRTPTGELLAPGARWHEPYTPPEGSPLHTKRNSANFGRPYGQWKTP